MVLFCSPLLERCKLETALFWDIINKNKTHMYFEKGQRNLNGNVPGGKLEKWRAESWGTKIKYIILHFKAPWKILHGTSFKRLYRLVRHITFSRTLTALWRMAKSRDVPRRLLVSESRLVLAENQFSGRYALFFIRYVTFSIFLIIIYVFDYFILCK